MKNRSNNPEDMIYALQHTFRTANAFLYIGKGAQQKDIDAFKCFPWQCVITLREDKSLLDSYIVDGERSVISTNTLSNLSLSRRNVYVFSPDSTNLFSIGQAFMPLRRMMNPKNQMVILGYTESADIDGIEFEIIKGLLQQSSAEQYEVWASTSEKLQKICMESGINCCEESPVDVLTRIQLDLLEEAKEESFSVSEEQDDIFYTAGKEIRFDPKEPYRSRNSAMLLSENTVYRINPEKDTKEKFKLFLDDSAKNAPQWYGYFRYNENEQPFYFQRSFEVELYKAVKKKLKVRTDPSPVILYGPPGSGKTMTLAAVAFRIFYERQYPVVYLNSGDRYGRSTFRKGSDELEELMNLLMFITRKTDTGNTVLLVWDSAHTKIDNAVYRSAYKNAIELIQNLQNIGKNVVLLCSAYIHDQDSDYSSDGPSPVEKADVIRATRTLNDSERQALRTRFSTYLENEKAFDIITKEFDSKNSLPDLFDYVYQLVSALRVPMQRGLSDEHDIGESYVRDQLKKVLKANVYQEKNQFYDFFRQHGITFSENPIPSEQLSTEKREIISQSLDQINLLVAMASVFGLVLPDNLAMAIISTPDMDYITSRQVFDIITEKIPWIARIENEGNFGLLFRNSLEAEYYLQQNDPEAYHRMDLILKISDLFQTDCNNNDYYEPTSVLLQDLFRLVGPNSKYYASYESNPFRNIWEDIREYAKKIHKSILSFEIEDYGFGILYVTYTRELYGRSDPSVGAESIGNNLKKMRDGVYFARLEMRDRIESALVNFRINDRRRYVLLQDLDNLAVEIAIYSTRMQALANLALNDLNDFEEISKVRKIMQDDVPTYKEISNGLLDALERNPKDTYRYNALFGIFDAEYNKLGNNNKTDKQLKLLSEILPVVEMCNEIGIQNLSVPNYQELVNRLSKISEYADNTVSDVTVETLKKRDDPVIREQHSNFFALFDQMMEEENPSCITFVCGRDYRKALAEYEDNPEHFFDTCSSIIELMRDNTLFPVICGYDFALYLLIQVTWAIYNHQLLHQLMELQVTHISTDGWFKLSELCDYYLNTSSTSKKNIVKLIGLLAKYYSHNISLQELAKKVQS